MIYIALENDEVLEFIGTPKYEAHKQKRFPAVDMETSIAKNEAFLLSSPELIFFKAYTVPAIIKVEVAYHLTEFNRVCSLCAPAIFNANLVTMGANCSSSYSNLSASTNFSLGVAIYLF